MKNTTKALAECTTRRTKSLTGSAVFGFKMSEGRCFAADLQPDDGTFAADTNCLELPSELLRRFLASLVLGIGVLLPWTSGEGGFLPRETRWLRSPCSDAEAIFFLTNFPQPGWPRPKLPGGNFPMGGWGGRLIEQVLWFGFIQDSSDKSSESSNSLCSTTEQRAILLFPI